MPDSKNIVPVFKNISPLGDLDLPILRRVVAAGEQFEATPDQAAVLFQQPDVWECVAGRKTFEHLLPVSEPVDAELVSVEPIESEGDTK